VSGSEPRVVRVMVEALRDEAVPELEWDAIESRLMARIDAPDASELLERVDAVRGASRGDDLRSEQTPLREASSETSSVPSRDRLRSARGPLRWIPLVAASLAVAAGVWAAARTENEGATSGLQKGIHASEPPREQPAASPGRAFERSEAAPEDDAAMPSIEAALPSASHGAPTPRSPRPQVAPSSAVVEPAVLPSAAPDAPRTAVTEAELRGRIEGCFSTVALPEAGRDGVAVGVGSTLRLQVAEDGSVVQAQFDPPLKPELQRCALFVLASRLGPGARSVAIPVRAR
jgi:hypothetical protein